VVRANVARPIDDEPDVESSRIRRFIRPPLDHEREPAVIAENRDRRRSIIAAPHEIEVLDEKAGERLHVSRL
jgi:hypothetical protein